MIKMRRTRLIRIFKPKRRNNGAMWASFIGLGLGAAVFGMIKGTRKEFTLPISDAIKDKIPKVNFPGMNNLVKNMAPNLNLTRMDNAALTEFSEDLLESALNKK